MSVSVEILLTTIYYTHVHAKSLTGEICHVRHVVAEVAKCHNPMKDRCPDAYPCREGWINGRIVNCDDVIDRVVEQRNQTRDANNSEWLT
jgi:hypothetical protein